MNPIHAVTIGIAVAAAAWDLKTRRIPNVLTFSAAGMAVIVHTFLGGWQGGGWAVAGWLVGASCFLPIFVLGGMGAGDVKLAAALGAWLGPSGAVWLALFSMIAGGAMGLIVSLVYGCTLQAFTNILWMFQFWSKVGPKPVPQVTLATHRGPRLAYAVPVFAGLLVTLWLR